MPKAAFALAAALLAGWALAPHPPAPPDAPPNAVTLLVTLGLHAGSVERWDGSVRLTGAKLLSLEGRHFSEGDRIAGSDHWVCATRADQVAPYADIHYTEMRPGAKPAPLFWPVGLWLTLEASPGAYLAIETAQGNFGFGLNEITTAPAVFLGGRVEVRRAPSVEKLTTTMYEDDEPSLVARRDGSLTAAWVAYRGRADRVFTRTLRNGIWSQAEEVTPQPADIFRTAAAEDGAGNLWIFWSQREGDRWQIFARQNKAGRWQSALHLTDAGSNMFHRVASAAGRIFLTWQSFRNGQSDIYLRVFDGGQWLPEQRVSESLANDWEPAVAAADGSAYIAWDGYEKGNYDVYFRAYSGSERNGRLEPVQAVTATPRFEAHASLAVDSQGRPWVAWDYSGVNWAKDQGFLIPTPLAVPIHQQRNIGLAVWSGTQWLEPRLPLDLPAPFAGNAEHPQIVFDGRGNLNLVFRHWTRRNSRGIGSPICWENYLTRWDGSNWSAPLPFPHSAGSIEKHAALSRGSSGDLWAAWMTDERPFSTQVPVNAEIYAARLTLDPAAPSAAPNVVPRREASIEAIPVHFNEPADVRAIRAYTIASAGKRYKIYRGDMHRHTDVSQDFKYDGSLIELYRYALDAASFDYIAATDHQSGYDQEYTWWENQQLVDLFQVPGTFTPLFAYERSVPYPNGHRNVIFAQRGVRTLPIPKDEMAGKTGAANLYEYLKRNGGISMPHSSATDQGTDWRDNDPDVEPLVEIYQGYRNSYEYEGAPRSATALNPQAQKSGWQPAGFVWNAWAKGYRLGVQSSSDHWSTHISYACLLAENFTREGLLDAIRRRHSYAATDNIVLDFRAGDHIMGDSFSSASAPRFALHAIGTGPILQIDLIKNKTLLYTTRPGTKEASFEFTDRDFSPGTNWYYVRILQQDGQLAWSSPIWVHSP
ncbi:MAG TPA: DUF3604 domain-containing protein [Bryobacterales bacterium]|nr:DUF3604 domain-containing protein [Bryobacterales bacterium]